MKKLAILALLLLSIGCTESNKYGKCVGVNPDENPKLKYEVEGFNVAIGVIFFEMVVPPIVVLLNDLYCPVGNKDEAIPAR